MPAFDETYEAHVWRVYGFIAYRVGSREDAEDLTSQTFERALRASKDTSGVDPTRRPRAMSQGKSQRSIRRRIS